MSKTEATTAMPGENKPLQKPEATAQTDEKTGAAAGGKLTTPGKRAAKKTVEPVAKPPPAKKVKLIRDSFTFPEADYALLGALKERALKSGCIIKKTELLRAGLMALQAMPDEKLVEVLNGVERIKTGRPAK